MLQCVTDGPSAGNGRASNAKDSFDRRRQCAAENGRRYAAATLRDASLSFCGQIGPGLTWYDLGVEQQIAEGSGSFRGASAVPCVFFGGIENGPCLCFDLLIRARDVMSERTEVRCEGAVHDEGRSIKMMGLEPAVLSDRPTAHPDELRARRGKCRMAQRDPAWSESASKATGLAGTCLPRRVSPPHTSQNKEIVPCRDTLV
jgi:hypothetical protein